MQATQNVWLNTSFDILSAMQPITASTIEQIDYLNIGLMVLSCILAFFFPFELFLFSYAILGPLHYLTEISWLQKKNYFTKGKKDHLILISIGFILLLIQLSESAQLLSLTASLMFFGFFGALVMLLTEKRYIRIIAALVIGYLALLIPFSRSLFAFFAILLPTIIHVFVFTGFFMLHGALKNKTRSGYLSLVVFVLSFAALLGLTIDFQTFTPSGYALDVYKSFEGVNLEIMNLMNINNPNIQQAIYQSLAGLSIMRVIAFAYTYHYLNWFAKTRIINWHQVGKKKLSVIIALWLISIALYIYNYEIGLISLFFLSVVHVLLEFPLNHLTMINIHKEIKGIFRPKSV